VAPLLPPRDERADLFEPLGARLILQDDIHPAALPGSWLYANSLLYQLKLEVDARAADKARA